MSILVKIGWIFFILSSKNHENRSDLSSRPVSYEEINKKIDAYHKNFLVFTYL